MNNLTHCPHCGQRLYEPESQEVQEVQADVLPAYANFPIEAQIMAGVPKIYIPKSEVVKNALREHFRLTPNWKTKFNREWMEWAVSVEMDDDALESAAEVWRMDKLFNWQAPNLKGIQEHWEELSSLQSTVWIIWVNFLRTRGKYNPYNKEEFTKALSHSAANFYVSKYGEDSSVKPIDKMSSDELVELFGYGLIGVYKNA